ncbi:hypothetical protein EJB05_21958, partial [Eragrostis curvula]
MTTSVGKMDSVIDHDDEIDHVIRTLCHETKNNAMLVDAPDVGNTAITEGLIQWIGGLFNSILSSGVTAIAYDHGLSLNDTKPLSLFWTKLPSPGNGV